MIEESRAMEHVQNDDVFAFVRAAYDQQKDQPFTRDSELALRAYAVEHLYPNQIGPGFKDHTQKDQVRPLNDRAGDFVIWQKILRLPRLPGTPAHLLLVTNDTKENLGGTDLPIYCRQEFLLHNSNSTLSPYTLEQFEQVFVRKQEESPPVESASSSSSSSASSRSDSSAVTIFSRNHVGTLPNGDFMVLPPSVALRMQQAQDNAALRSAAASGATGWSGSAEAAPSAIRYYSSGPLEGMPYPAAGLNGPSGPGASIQGLIAEFLRAQGITGPQAARLQ